MKVYHVMFAVDFSANDISVVSPSSECDLNKNKGLSSFKIVRIHVVSFLNEVLRSLEESRLHIKRVVTDEVENEKFKKPIGTTKRKVFSSADFTGSHISVEVRTVAWLKGK
jgi:hypothetical protein